MKFELEPLPYALDALEPHISARTLDLHYDKHHRGYLEKLKSGIEGSPQAELSLKDLVLGSEGDVYNNAAQTWNHTFYWHSMSPEGGGSPDELTLQRLERDFGGLNEFKREFASAAAGEFGSGWAWLVETESGRLRIMSTTDAENPMRLGYRPLLTLDVWEHAYYLDHQNERGKYIEAFLDSLINWEFVAANLESVSGDPKGSPELREAV